MTEMCAWCDGPAVTDVIIVPGRAKRKTAPVCEEHAADFEARGQMTIRLEVDQKLRKDLKKSEWVRRTW